MSVCYNCTQRKLGCHSVCERYQQEVSDNKAIKDKQKEETAYRAYEIETRIRLKARILRLKRSKKI